MFKIDMKITSINKDFVNTRNSVFNYDGISDYEIYTFDKKSLTNGDEVTLYYYGDEMDDYIISCLIDEASMQGNMLEVL